MAKKQTSINKDNLALVTSIAALIVAVVAFAFAAFIWDDWSLSKKQYADQVYNLTLQNARQDLCLEEAIKPCTQEEINKRVEAKN